jgi:hypothetical protein
MKYQKLIKEFDSLSAEKQWKWALKHKDKIQIYLDNDCTDFTFNNEDKTEDATLFSFKSDIGDRAGVEIVLKMIGFSVEYV